MACSEIDLDASAPVVILAAIGEGGDETGLSGESGRAGGDLNATRFVCDVIRAVEKAFNQLDLAAVDVEASPPVSIERGSVDGCEESATARVPPAYGPFKELRRKGFPDIGQELALPSKEHEGRPSGSGRGGRVMWEEPGGRGEPLRRT